MSVLMAADEEQDWPDDPADDAEMVAAFCTDWLGHLPAPEEPDRCEKCDLIFTTKGTP